MPGKLLALRLRILVEEFVDGEVASADSHIDLVVLHADVNTLSAELVDALTLAIEHDAQALAVRVVVDEFRESAVYGVVLHGNVQSKTLLQVDNLFLQELYLCLSLLQ